MPAFARLAFPLFFAGALLVLAWLWPGGVSAGARSHPAPLVGLLVDHADGTADLITGITHEVRVEAEGTTPRELRFENYHPPRADSLDPLVQAFLRGGGGSHGLGRLDRECATHLGVPLSRLSIRETISGRFGLNQPPSFPLPTLGEALETRVRIVAWEWNSGPDGPRRPTLREPESPSDQPKSLWFASAPRDSLFITLFRFANEKTTHRANFGRLGAVHPAAPPFTMAQAYLDKTGRPQLIPVLDKAARALPPLERFSRLCEVFFTRTAYPLVLIAGALLMLLAAALTCRFDARENALEARRHEI